jgi:hypothetical protein
MFLVHMNYSKTFNILSSSKYFKSANFTFASLCRMKFQKMHYTIFFINLLTAYR